MQLVTWSWSQCSCTILKILGSLRMKLNVLYLCSINRTTKPGWQNISLQHGLLKSLSPLLRPIAQGEKMIPFKILLLIGNAPANPGTMMEMDSEINVVMPAHTACIVQSMDQWVISLRNTFYRAVAAIDKYSSYGSGQNKLKTSWKAFTMLDAFKNICDS